MKRDPRLLRGGERRSPRRLHGLRFDPGTIVRRRIYEAFGLSRGAQAWVERSGRALRAFQDQQEAIMLRTMRVGATEVSRRIEADLALAGHSYVRVGLDESPLLRTGRLSGPERGGWLYARLPQPRAPYAPYGVEYGTGPFGGGGEAFKVEWDDVAGSIEQKLSQAEYDALLKGILETGSGPDDSNLMDGLPDGPIGPSGE